MLQGDSLDVKRQASNLMFPIDGRGDQDQSIEKIDVIIKYTN